MDKSSGNQMHEVVLSSKIELTIGRHQKLAPTQREKDSENDKKEKIITLETGSSIWFDSYMYIFAT